MNLYRDDTGAWHRTQAEAKQSGRPWSLVEVPTDHKGLHAFLNSLRANDPDRDHQPEQTENSAPDVPDREHIVTSPDQLPPYKNGDPTGVFLRSRNPTAIFTCTACGHHNRNQAQ